MKAAPILTLKSIALAIAAWLLADAHFNAALVCAIASPIILVFAIVAWREGA